MKLGRHSCLTGVVTPLILAGPASAGFVGIEVVSKPEAHQYGLTTMNIYAIFDRPGEDFMQAVAGTPNNPLIFEWLNGTFFEHSLGSLQAPLQVLVDIFPSLAFDSFVTIGVKSVGDGGQPVDQLTLTTTFPYGIGPGPFILTNDAWAVTPLNEQGDPFNPDFVAGDGSVLIGQFSSADSTCFQGQMLLQFVSNGQVVQQVVSFFHVSPTPGALAVLGLAGLVRPGARRRPLAPRR